MKIKNTIKQRRIIYGMIDASCELAERKGAHALENGCNCISCIKKRKRLLKNSEPEREWKHIL